MSKYDILAIIFVVLIIGIAVFYYFDTDEFQLKCIVSGVDGDKYCVRENHRMQEAADLLANATEKAKKLIAYLNQKYSDKENVKRLVDGFNPQKIQQSLPSHKYTAFSENKGERLVFCLYRKKENERELIDEHTLFFVYMHELSHVMTASIGHNSEFWENFKFLLEEAQECGLHQPQDYKNKPAEYCSMPIRDNPYYDA